MNEIIIEKENWNIRKNIINEILNDSKDYSESGTGTKIRLPVFGKMSRMRVIPLYPMTP